MTEVRPARSSEQRGDKGRFDVLRRKPRTAFVLSGGGNLGAIQVGMLRALVEAGVVPDVVLGCSIGAMNGAAFALDPTLRGVEALTATWESAGAGDIMPSSRLPNAVQMFRRGASMYDGSGLRRGIESLLGGKETFDDLTLPFQCNAADVDSAMTTWFSEGDLILPLLASAALPAVYPPVVINGRTYIDGGVIENVPIGRAVELGCRTIYVLHVGNHGRPVHELRRPLDGALQAYWVARNSQFARDLASLPDKVEALVLPPGPRPDLRHDDFSRTQELVERGFDNTVRFLDEHAERDDGWFSSDLLRPIERLVLNARSKKWRQAARDAAHAPEGAVISSGHSHDESLADNGVDNGVDNRADHVAEDGGASSDERADDERSDGGSDETGAAEGRGHGDPTAKVAVRPSPQGDPAAK